MTLEAVTRKVYKSLDKNKVVREKIDVEAVKKDFERMEALRTNGWWQE